MSTTTSPDIDPTDMKILAALQTDPVIYSDPQRAGEVGREHREAESRLGLLYAEWEAIAAEPAEE